MKIVRFGWFLSLLIALLSGMACAQLPSQRTHAALPSGPAVIVIAPRPIPTDDQASEAYADWAGYLNDFAGSKPRTLRLARMTPVQWKTLAGHPVAQDGYATAFVRRNGSALFYQGMILEPDLYRQGVAWLVSEKAGSAATEGFSLIRIARGGRK